MESKPDLNLSTVNLSRESQMKFWKDGNAEQADNVGGEVGRDTRTTVISLRKLNPLTCDKDWVRVSGRS